MFRSKITRSEWWWVAVASVTTMAITLLPYIYGWAQTPSGKVFTWAPTISSNDVFTYWAWFEQGRQGHFFFINLFNTEAQPAVLFHPLFSILGVLGFITDMPNMVVYHLGRVLAGLVFLPVLYLFLTNFFAEISKRRLAFLITVFSAGFGSLFTSLSTDLWMTESITFLNLHQSVINISALIFILLIFHIALNTFELPKRSVVLVPALLLNLLIIFHMYDLLIVAGVLGAYVLVESYRTKNYYWLRNFSYLILLAMPALLWQFHVLNQNVVLAVWATIQTNVPSHETYYYLSGYGLLLVFAFAGLSHKVAEKDYTRISFLVVWVVFIGAMLYFPWLARFQRKFSEGLHIPIAVLASMGLVWWWDQIGLRNKYGKRLAIVGMAGLLSMTSLYHLYNDTTQFDYKDFPYYIDSGVYDAAVWIRENTIMEDKVLSGNIAANVIPGIAGRRVFVRWGDQTINFEQKSEITKQVLASAIDHTDPLKAFIKQEDINYIFIDNEVRFETSWDIAQRDYLKLVYENTDVQIYQIDQNNLD